ncbi:unnamed protein product [Phytophthora lilii]|uniref:Unnamed protein product n=1 Tax=Phytophthora lilii TaxID=2077276 RepID=A0A9W6U9J8_9STRA|nr:unnamed protein product [Phytophthora lilii]
MGCVTSAHSTITLMAYKRQLPADPTQPVILIANHQVDADWWYIWQAARRQRAAGNVKIVLKDQLKYLPIIGWGMRLFQFLFLRRRIDEDEAHIKKYMYGLIADDFPFWLVLFPEGTTIHSEYVGKSQAFAAREGRPKFERVLLPRTTGMQIILDAVEEAKPDIYDLTLAFPSYSGEVPTYDMGYGRKVDTEVPSMKSLLAGKAPVGRVAMHSRRFSYEDAATDLQGFLDARWKEKEERLNYFIEHQRFPGEETTVEMELSVSESDPGLRYARIMMLAFVLVGNVDVGGSRFPAVAWYYAVVHYFTCRDDALFPMCVYFIYRLVCEIKRCLTVCLWSLVSSVFHLGCLLFRVLGLRSYHELLVALHIQSFLGTCCQDARPFQASAGQVSVR